MAPSPPAAPPERRPSLFSLRRATGRLFVALAVGVVGTAIAPAVAPLHVRAVVGWDLGALILCLLLWNIIGRASAAETARRAAVEDPGRTAVFLVAVAASFFSLFAGAFVLRPARTLPGGHVWTGLALLAIVLSWVLTHTIFTLRYAHLFYRRRGSGGLVFPGTERPCELDFAYFAFTLGMCFQVSDVAVTSSRIRRVALLHALISFVYNTSILALALNLFVGLLG